MKTLHEALAEIGLTSESINDPGSRRKIINIHSGETVGYWNAKTAWEKIKMTERLVDENGDEIHGRFTCDLCGQEFDINDLWFAPTDVKENHVCEDCHKKVSRRLNN